MADIEIYTTSTCPFCYRAKQLLQAKNVRYTEIDVTGDSDTRARMRARAGAHTVPQIFIDGQPVGGCDELYALEDAGKLDPLLAG